MVNYIVYAIAELATAYRVYFKWRLSESNAAVPMLKESSNETPQEEDVNWYNSKRHVFTDRFFFAVIFGHAVVGMGLYFLALGLSSPVMWGEFSLINSSCTQHRFITIAYIFLLLYTLSIIIYFIYNFSKHLRGKRDGLRFKRDLKVLSIVWLIAFIGWGVFSLGYPNPIGRAVFTLGGFAFAFWLTTFRSTLETFPTFSLNKRASKGPENEEEIDTMELGEVLRSKGSKQMFREFLQSEWSAENLLFWEDVDYFQKVEGPENIIREGTKIYEKYFTERPTLELNLSFIHMKKVRINVNEAKNDPEKWSNEMYNEAQKAMFHLMATDSFVRFKSKVRERRMSLEIERGSRSSTDLPRTSIDKGKAVEMPQIDE